ncbi:hypothetical protein H9P43_005808 [Blastocladiella emersonii ATCC 22665]|nr:hypothetical protein H9P43_005808 [Blastocladiella emersonii ATCC 22665]
MNHPDSHVYLAYAKAIGGASSVFLVILVLVLSQLFRVGSDLWLSWWTSDSFGLDTTVYLWVYFGLGIAQAIAYVLSGVQFALAGLRASKVLHRGAVYRVMRAPMSWYDTTPIGRIISRFSKDTDTMDANLPDSFRMFLGTLSMTVSTFALMIAATPLFAAPLAPLMVVYYYAQLFYRSTSRELKRLDSVSRSPLFALFGETLTGIVTIRAYREENHFIERNSRYIDDNNRCYYLQICSQRWLSIRIENIGNLLTLACAMFGVASVLSSSTSVAIVGLSISYAINTSGVLNWCVRQAAETEVSANSVERILSYIEDIEIEAPLITDVRPPSAAWPERGEIEFTNAVMAYRKGLDPVLKDVSFTIPAGSKLAIVGRTGAGKSTSLIALFRMAELISGSITIDGVDIGKLGLHDLRKRLSIIPQEPVLFSGTIRSNLDREGVASDDQLWACLKAAGMFDYVQNLPEKLEAPISEGGENLSTGMRQLMCLARAMLRSAKILVMDEATASVDQATDAQIQRAIRRDFANATVVTIAHRLNTVIDYDLVLVMDNGRVAELASPAELLSRPESLFTALVDETGPVNAALLRRLATEKKLEL